MTTVWFSLRKRLLALLLGGVTVAWLGTLVFSYLDAHHEVDELFDAQLAQAAQTLLALASHEDGDHIEDLGDAGHKYQRQLRFQLWSADGRLLLRSQNAPESPLTAISGFSETSTKSDGHWRHYSQWNNEKSLQIQVSENHRIRDELIGQIAWRLLFPALLGLPLIGFWVWLATRHGLSSLDNIAREITQRDPQQLYALTPDAAPVEIRPLLEALNDLLGRVGHALDNERRFTADAAHELRTPLAALLAQLQVAQRARNDEERTQSLDQLQTGLHRAAHLVEQMLQLARLDPENGLPDAGPVSLTAVCEDVCAELGKDILARQIDFSLDADGEGSIHGKAEWLRVLVRNLLDNALRYTQQGGAIRVAIRQSADAATLEIADNGPGIPAEQRAEVCQRFHRLDQTGLPGSGLGLAIVARIVELHGASLQLNDSPFGQGLSVCLRFRKD
ncbi:ATP-binding protein [Dechloromonas sp.]|uniref:ATP-binding protein n=1 Tax=Dechloromonas sp. TaxID=1917218 RepID=UPI0012032521|nr:ATP-binding protein [Dechloromonas sp.]MBU3696672.1 two-component sensor histidine kinase [Dechloromonas sp.]TEX44646.1 MAG: two-component sensor histidine kinase [Rhodocyclaceae bacterium]